MSDDKPNPLDLVSTNDIVEELKNRFDSMVIGAWFGKDQEHANLAVFRSGSFPSTLGIVQLLDEALREEFYAAQVDPDETEEPPEEEEPWASGP